MGPKCPQKRASRHVFNAGMVFLRRRTAGIRRKRRISIKAAKRRKGVIVIGVSGHESVNWDQGIMAPKYTNIVELRRRSITFARFDVEVLRENQPSEEKVAPAEKVKRKSSTPSVEAMPTLKIARRR